MSTYRNMVKYGEGLLNDHTHSIFMGFYNHYIYSYIPPPPPPKKPSRSDFFLKSEGIQCVFNKVLVSSLSQQKSLQK